MSSSRSYDISQETRGKAILEYVSAGLAVATGGFSEVLALPMRNVVERRLQELEEILVEEIRTGCIDESAVIEEDRGAGKKKLRIIARYFFKNVGTVPVLRDNIADFASVTEQLTDPDMRCLAAIKRARMNGFFERETAEGADPMRMDRGFDFDGNFPNQKTFNEAAIALVRFGFIYMGSAWDEVSLSLTARGMEYVNNLDLECIQPS
jgi:hypothetical protein